MHSPLYKKARAIETLHTAAQSNPQAYKHLPILQIPTSSLLHVQTACIAMANRGSAALTIACLLIVAVTLADALPPTSPLHCKTVYGVQKRETCFAVAQAAGLPLKKFLQFNPNINCNNLFIGQWVCLALGHA